MDKLDYNTLYHLYIEEMMSTQQVADCLNTTYGSVNYYLLKYNIRKNGKRIKIDEEEFKEQYLNKRTSLEKMAEYFNCCYATIRNYAKKFNIERTNGNNNAEYFDIVKEKYLNEKKSIRMIASELGLPPTRIRQILMQAGVKRRDQSESHLIYNDGYKEFSIDWSLMEDDLLKRCRHYFSNHIPSTIEKVQCEDCDATEHLHIHHIKSLSLIVQEIKDENPNKTEDELYNIIIHDNRFLSKDNLKVVCEDCHYTKYHSYLGYKKKNNQIVNQQPSLSNKEGSTTIESIVRE